MKEDTIETWYHYTAFEKFKCILENGTLRFKLSTQSNDILDTRYFVDLLKESNLADLCESSEEVFALSNFCAGYFKSEIYHPKVAAYVVCFTERKDSRLLWDAYTMNRPKLTETETESTPKYNGIIIGFNAEKIREFIRQYDDAPGFAGAYVQPIIYEKDQQLKLLGACFSELRAIYEAEKNNPDQSQNLIPPIQIGNNVISLKKCLVEPMTFLINKIETLAPAMKHEFWQEEKEVRGILCRYSFWGNKDGIEKGEGDNRYIDLPIKEDMIETIVLGPEFGDAEKQELESMTNAKIRFENIKHEVSKGTGVIRYR